MTKYYVHIANASKTPTIKRRYPIYGLPKDEQRLSLKQASSRHDLIRFRYGKQY